MGCILIHCNKIMEKKTKIASELERIAEKLIHSRLFIFLPSFLSTWCTSLSIYFCSISRYSIDIFICSEIFPRKILKFFTTIVVVEFETRCFARHLISFHSQTKPSHSFRHMRYVDGISTARFRNVFLNRNHED